MREASGNFAEATLKAPASADVSFGIASTLTDWRTTSLDFRFLLSNGGGGQVLEIYDGATLIYTESAAAYYSTGIRVRIELLGSRVRFFKNYAGPGSQPLVESRSVPQLPAYVVGVVSVTSVGNGTIADVMMTTVPDAKAVVTQAQKTQYGIGTTVYANVYRLDPRAGRGFAAKVALVAE